MSYYCDANDEECIANQRFSNGIVVVLVVITIAYIIIKAFQTIKAIILPLLFLVVLMVFLRERSQQEVQTLDPALPISY